MFDRVRLLSRGAFALLLVMTLSVSSAWAAGKLVGSAVDVNGDPLEGVQVKMIPLDGDLPTVEAKSNKKGKFVFGLLRPANYRMVAFMDGMRISRISANVAVPEDDSVWAYDDAVPPGAEMPAFNITGLSEATYDLTFAPSTGGPGQYGTGEPVSPTVAIVDRIQAGQLDEALAEIGRALEFAPDNATLHYLKGFALKGLGRFDDATAAARRTLEVDSDFEGANVLLAKILEDQGDHEGALAAYEREREVAKSPEVQRDVYLGIAACYIRLQRLEDAVAALEQLIVVEPDNVGAYKELADLYTRLGREEQAKAMLDKVSMFGATDPNVLYNMGAERYNAGDLEAAADYFQQAIDASPDFADAHRQLAFARVALGQRDAAVEHLRKYLELNDDDADPNVQAARAILQQLTQ